MIIGQYAVDFLNALLISCKSTRSDGELIILSSDWKFYVKFAALVHEHDTRGFAAASYDGSSVCAAPSLAQSAQ